MLDRMIKLLIVLAFLLMPVAVLSNSATSDDVPQLTFQTVWDSDFTAEAETFVRQNLPHKKTFSMLGVNLRYFGGQREQDGIMFGSDGLLKRIDAPIEPFVEANTQAVLSFAQQGRVNTCLMLIPTASAIRQEYLPDYAQAGMFNQKQFIEDIYNRMAGSVTVADAYSTLFNNRDQYIYYRTENNLTALGGYYLYTALGSKLGIQNISYNQFDISYAGVPYYGDLYRRVPYSQVRPDTFLMFRYASLENREYLVTHKGYTGERIYHSLYQEHLLELEPSTDVYLGGLSAITDIVTSHQNRKSLLIFCDKTALSYVPFLVDSYERITLVDLFQITDAQYSEIRPQDYTQVLYAYSIESYMHTNIPLRADKLIAQMEDDTEF